MKSLKSILEGIFDNNVTTELDLNEEFIKSYIKEKIKDCKKKHLYVQAFFPKEEGYSHEDMICAVTLYT